MGFFKKIFKPVSKVLDKIIPNEIKPALPYMAAFAPFIAPGIMGTSVMQRALMGGGLNIFGQLSQEGNEGDINLLSAGLGALSGAMTTPGGKEYFNMRGELAGEGTGLMSKAKQFGFETLGKGADIMEAGIADPFSKAGLKAAALPAATATGDLMFAQNKRDQDAYDDMMAAEADAEYASDASRALAIRQSMESYGFSEEEILAAIEAAGYKAGGRVGFQNGGSGTKSMNEIRVDEMMTIAKDIRENNDVSYGEASDLADIIDYYKYGKGQSETYTGDNPIIKFHLNIKNEEAKATGGRVGFRFGGIDKAIEGVSEEIQKDGQEGIMTAAKEDPMLVEEYNKYVFDLMEQRPDAKPMTFQDFKRMIMSGMKTGGRVKAEEGGLMNLGGKEMDLRGGGFVPIGKKERADDVPARLSKNEFVMTADAVRAAGGGSVNKGAKRMYDVMNKLEARA